MISLKPTNDFQGSVAKCNFNNYISPVILNGPTTCLAKGLHRVQRHRHRDLRGESSRRGCAGETDGNGLDIPYAPCLSMSGIFSYMTGWFLVNVGKYSSTMEHAGMMGMCRCCQHSLICLPVLDVHAGLSKDVWSKSNTHGSLIFSNHVYRVRSEKHGLMSSR